MSRKRTFKNRRKIVKGSKMKKPKRDRLMNPKRAGKPIKGVEFGKRFQEGSEAP